MIICIFLLLIHMVCTMINIVIMIFNNRGTKWKITKTVSRDWKWNKADILPVKFSNDQNKMFKVVKCRSGKFLTQMFSHRVQSFSVAILHRKLYNREWDGNAWRWVEIPPMLFIRSYHNFVKSVGLCNVSLSFEVNDYSIKVWSVSS